MPEVERPRTRDERERALLLARAVARLGRWPEAKRAVVEVMKAVVAETHDRALRRSVAEALRRTGPIWAPQRMDPGVVGPPPAA